MAKDVTSNTNILPNNPMKQHDLLEHLKKVKGDMGWYEFNLHTLIAAYPDDKMFKQALEAELKAKADKVTTATDATTADKPVTEKPAKEEPAPAPEPKPASQGGNTKGRKTAAEVKVANAAKGEKADSLMPTTADIKELANIK